ncbi:transglutaminase domain-containing protein [Clostridium sp. DJ247]|uniref:transglutaminase domain-containing protein n=1 Tax=Clostridium sp. DJ247 TaxID=2726188 RepID=UPI00162577FC|nr:transglutaminase domain-containing protein [Clostridium sp. DJ247]MBC2581981.1 transglutaminase [Clostridium sp. DJ247]
MIIKCNIKRLVAFKLQALVISLILLFYTNIAFAQDNYKVFDAQQNVSSNKIWTIKFSQNIDKNSVTGDNIKIIDENGNSLKLDLSCSGNSIAIKPVSNYEPGKNYNIYVDNIKSSSGHNLKSPATMKFTVKNDVQSNQQVNAYSLVDTHTYKITDTLTFTAEQETKLRLNYNIGSLSNSPYQKEIDLNVSGENAKIISEDSSYKKLTGDSYLKPGEKLQYQVVRTIQTSGIKYIKDLSKTSGDYNNFSEYNKYTAPSEKIESDNEEIVNKSKEIFSGITNPYYKAKKAYEFVNNYMNYDESNKNKGALNALQTSKGVCEDYSELFVALLRASGVPARVVTGFWIDKNNFNNNIANGDNYRHAWAEYYLPEYGWIVVEPTNIYYYNGNKTIDYDYFSNLDGASHFIVGYDAAGDYKDNNIYYYYSAGSGVTVNTQTSIEEDTR